MVVTLREFLKLYNFKYINVNQKENTQIVRIYIEFPNRWFEFGINDWVWKSRDELVESIINTSVLDKEVTSVSYDEDNEVFCIYTEEVEK